MLELSGVPAGFVPGQDVTFDVLLRDATDLASYNIVLTLQLAAGTIGTDAHFIVPGAASSHYVFGLDTTCFAAAVQTVGATQALTISDFHDPDGDGTLNGVITVAGANDRIATVTVSTHAGTCGDLSLSFDTSPRESRRGFYCFRSMRVQRIRDTLVQHQPLGEVGGRVTLLRDPVAVTGQTPLDALAAASHPRAVHTLVPRR